MDNSNKDIHMNEIKMYINEYGDKVYKNSKGEYHRLDGPAVEWVNKSKFWYKEGLCHREDGPAIEKKNGDKLWYKEGMWHRVDGPAIEYAHGSKFWFILNDGLEDKEFNSWIIRIQKCI